MIGADGVDFLRPKMRAKLAKAQRTPRRKIYQPRSAV
jgi:hypothetical protein